MKKVALKTIGCKLNQYETQLLGEQFLRCGYQWVTFGERADVYILNTCTVTSKADYSSRQAVSRARRLAERGALSSNGSPVVVVTGCYAEIEPHKLLDLPGVDLVVGNDHKPRLVEIVQEFLSVEAKRPAFVPSPPRGARSLVDSPSISGMRGYTRAFVRIQDGCNSSCSYCIIPQARGGEVSKPLEAVLEEARRLIDSGFREIVLTGIHIGRYRDGRMRLTDLLARLLEDNPETRFRLSSIEPEEVTEELIDLFADHRNLCPHLHIAIQSADDEVIGAMNRRYTSLSLHGLLERVTSRVPRVTVGADFIVGFPGESDDRFLNTMSFVEKSSLAYLHVFSYSDRPGTAASSFEGKVPPEVKSRRSRLLIGLGKSMKWRHLQKFLGQRLEVLVESRRHRKTGLLTGLSDNYLRLLFGGGDDLKGQVVMVKARELHDAELVGEVVQNAS
jgi:threonylcarbamoyladenosine tRNA methylthiotransferase MtaB